MVSFDRNGSFRPIPAFYLEPSQTGFRPVGKTHLLIPELISNLAKSARGRRDGEWVFPTEMGFRPVGKNPDSYAEQRTTARGHVVGYGGSVKCARLSKSMPAREARRRKLGVFWLRVKAIP